ncbi:hypothetical protein RB195_008545 [Necator americanus]|uniref:Spermine/spermidine synthase n=1 Tax=Necator americanus TaxID=51031 RepID=A0ABR1CR17_NECAM
MSSRLYAVRVITPDFVNVHSNSPLTLPDEFCKNDIDTSRWKVNKKFLLNNVHLKMAELIFSSGAANLSRNTSARMLLIGLGGGTLNGFLHHNFPKMNITVVEISDQMVYMARKWFDLKTNDRHQVVITDGVKYIEDQIRKGTKYDVVAVDACDSNPSLKRKLVCPLDVFLKENVIKNLTRLITSRGILIISTFTVNMTDVEVHALLETKFSNFIKYCNIAKKTFYCTHHQPEATKSVDLLDFVKNVPLKI